MDTFAHGIWTYIIFQHTGSLGPAIIMGVFPDLLSWGIYLFYTMVTRRGFGKPRLDKIPKWVFTLYGITHSLVLMGLIYIGLALVYGNIPVFMYAWLIHVLIDIPTHSRDYLPTPFLWPISDWRFPGFSWPNRYFMISNYLAMFYLLIF